MLALLLISSVALGKSLNLSGLPFSPILIYRFGTNLYISIGKLYFPKVVTVIFKDLHAFQTMPLYPPRGGVHVPSLESEQQLGSF